MKIIILLLAVMLLSGCSTYEREIISNDEIIKETKKCEDAGLKAVLYNNSYHEPRMIICKPNNK